MAATALEMDVDKNASQVELFGERFGFSKQQFVTDLRTVYRPPPPSFGLNSLFVLCPQTPLLMVSANI